MGGPRVVVVGAGPAGVRAAEALVQAGLRPAVVYDHARDGGQIYRRQPEGFTRTYATLYGKEAERARLLHGAFAAIRGRIDDRPSALAWNVWENELHVVSGERSTRLQFDALIICSGAVDRLFPVAGWHLAGTYSLGAAQIALKAQGCAIGRNIVLAGTGPLLYLVAKQYVMAGATVAAVLDTSAFGLRIKALPGLLTRPGTFAKGVGLVAALRRAGVPMETGITPVEITGGEEFGVTGFAWRGRDGKPRRVDCDAVGLGYHVSPETQLADLAGCRFEFDGLARQWLPVLDADGRSSRANVYLAGDGASVAGADAAELAGRLAALAALHDLGQVVDPGEVVSLRRRLG
ncbi:MAG: NAD(P)/FAD-dependent oxidoreductase, partial [Hyphomicrobiaceae bacterium]